MNRSRIAVPRGGLLVCAAVLVALLTGCADLSVGNAAEGDARTEYGLDAGIEVQQPQPHPTTAADLRERIGQLPGVADVEGEPGPDSVVLAADATRDEILGVVEKTNALAAASGWHDTVSLTRDDGVAGAAPNPEWTVEIYPASAAASVGHVVDLLDVEDHVAEAGMTGHLEIGLTGGWPFATVTDVTRFGSIFDLLRVTTMFRDGGTYSTGGDHLGVVHVPARTSVEAVHAIVDIAADYPGAEVLLQSPTQGPQWPKLYVARLSTEEAAAIDARLRSPELADTDPDGPPAAIPVGGGRPRRPRLYRGHVRRRGRLARV